MDIAWGPVGYVTYKRTYARRLNENDPNSATEEFEDTIERILKACHTQLKCGFTPDEENRLRFYFTQMKGSVAGRFWWQLGSKTVDKLGLASLQNCAVTVVDEPIRPFTWTMDMLMLGCGVGYNIGREYVYQLPRPMHITATRQDTKDADFIVPDSREGWVELLRKVLEAHFVTGKSFTYSTVLVRGKGAVIGGFGGIASGPEELCWGMTEINKLLNLRAGNKVRSIDALDIMNIIGFIVVSGNVRRSAEIAGGDFDDIQYLNAKRWDLGNIPNHRAMSNNSVICNDFDSLPEQFWQGYHGNGEPYGLINLKLSKSCGRVGDTRYKDNDIIMFNPCAEQSLAKWETCALAEFFLPNLSSIEEMKDMSELIYRIVKHSLALPCHNKETEEIVHKNMRMGLGITGYLQASEEQKQWLPEVYEHLRAYDVDYSKKHGFNVSIKLTTCKPSGTLSKLPGVTSGVHPGWSRFYTQRIRMSSNSPLVETCRNHGYDVEFQRNFDGSEDYNTVVVSFPCSFPEGTICAKDVTAIQQLEYVCRLQRDWSDNAVSCTVYYKTEELPEIKAWLSKNYNNSLKTVSFLRHSDHGFDQAPWEEITEEQFLEMSKKVTIISKVKMGEEEIQSSDCDKGMCPIR